MNVNCPMCVEQVKAISIFEAKKALVSVGELSREPKMGGGIGKGVLEIKLMQCPKCGYIWNINFDNQKMSEAYFHGEYITPKAISKTMNANVKFLVEKFKQHSSKDTIYLEIAPGGCDILFELAKFSPFCYSIDPSLTPSLLLKDCKNVSHVRDFFSYEKVAKQLKHKINFIIFRHLIEHICEPRKFLEDVVKLLEIEGMIYIETPNMLNIVECRRFFEIRHEHCGYYEENTLINILNDLGCELVETLHLYEGQNIGLFFKRREIPLKLEKQISLFDANLGKCFQQEIDKLESFLNAYQNIALYGAASHANSLLSYLSEKNCQKIKMAIDKDERRQGTYLQNSCIKVMKPTIENLQDIECIIMAMPLYEKVVFENELKGIFQGDIIFTSNKIIKYKQS